MATCFIYFGDSTFAKYKHSCQTFSIDNNTDLINKTGIIFDSLKVNDTEHKINDVVCCWSFVLYLTDKGIFYCGFKNKLPTVDPVLLKLKDGENIDAKHVEHFAAGFSKALLTNKSQRCFCISDCDNTSILHEIETSVMPGKLNQVITSDICNYIVTADELMYRFFNLNDKPEVFITPLKVTEVACGKEHTILLTNLGSIFSFGAGSRGQLGHGAVQDEDKPKLIEALDGIKIESISAGGWHSAAISVFGDLYTWGWNESGQLGRPCCTSPSENSSVKKEEMSFIPKLLDFPMESKILKISLGSRHSAVLLDINSLLTFGWNGYGQLGRDVKPCSHIPTALALPHGLVIQNVQCSTWSTLITMFQKNV